MLRRRMMGQGSKVVVYTDSFTNSIGTWRVPAGCEKIEVFLVGGGGGGAYGAGGGGYTALYTDEPIAYKNGPALSVTPGETLYYTVGPGGKAGGMNGSASPGVSSSFGGLSANGGEAGTTNYLGGYGGSGGAGYTHATGGRNGGNGAAGNLGTGGKGQGYSTICPFNNIEYSAGGSTGRNVSNPDSIGSDENTKVRHGKPNTGEGGSGSGQYGGNGGSGIIVIRYKILVR